MTLARVVNTPCRKAGVFSLDLSEMRPVNVVTSLMCTLKRPLRYGGYSLCETKINRTILRCVKFKRTMLSNMLTAKAILRALPSSYLIRYNKNNHSVATTPLQFCNGLYNFVTELSHTLCNVFAYYTFWHKIIRIKLDH